MDGFGICAWWKISHHHHLTTIVKKISQQCTGTMPFPPHITLMTHVTDLKQLTTPDFTIITTLPLRMTETVVWDHVLYAVELPVVHISPLPKNAHISIAYRIGVPFNEEDIQCMLNILHSIGDASVDPVDLQACYYNCSSRNITKWQCIDL